MKAYLFPIILLIIYLVAENPLYVEARCIVDEPCYAPTNPEITDPFGHQINVPVTTGQQIQIIGYLTNNYNNTEPFAYIVQIQDSNGVTVSLSWITGILAPFQSFNPSQSWIPTTSGSYEASVFFWQSLKNPNNPLRLPISTSISVV